MVPTRPCAALWAACFLVCAAASAGCAQSVTSSGGGSTSTTTGGTGGATGGTGGMTGGTGGTTTSSTTSSTGPTVTCNYPNVSECMPGQVCCFGPSMPTDDCGPPGSCNPPTDYIEIACDQDADCEGNPTKKKCCAYFAGDINGNLTIQKTYCDTSCDLASQETKACLSTADCDGLLTCQEMLGSAYPDTKFCLSPL